MSPEMCKKNNNEGYSGKIADIWALGVTFWSFTFMNVPFIGSNISKILENIQNQEFLYKKKINN